jgi:hypothetical protein
MIGLLCLGGALIFLVRFIIRRRANSNRPVLTILLDTLVEIPAALKIGPWKEPPNVHTALEMAFKETGLTDLGTTDMGFVERYAVAKTVGLERSHVRYSPMGTYVIQNSIMQRFTYRLRLVDYFKKHPSIADVKLKAPIFVIGFPRTGTTYLHELLGLNDGVRSHRSWEQLSPIPKTDDESIEAQEADRQKRYKTFKPVFDVVFKALVHEKIQHIHRIEYDEPEECTIPCASELPWAMTELPFMVYACDKVFPLGAGSAFKMYRQFLQLMTWQAADRRDTDFTWMLKSPFHLPYLEALFKEFPDATVVWTHRDPSECIASACSLYETILEMGMEQSSIDRKILGEAVTKYTKLSLQKAEETLDKLQKNHQSIKMVHIRYMDNVKEPKKICRQVYDAVSSIDVCFYFSSYCNVFFVIS